MLVIPTGKYRGQSQFGGLISLLYSLLTCWQGSLNITVTCFTESKGTRKARKYVSCIKETAHLQTSLMMLVERNIHFVLVKKLKMQRDGWHVRTLYRLGNQRSAGQSPGRAGVGKAEGFVLPQQRKAES